ncbi:hypothetical protein M3M33_05240 [Loigolactobacillus coryniformis]|uniref:hypothetical protein n=1 Tax=Loigolactobacillus coryniformis TaxID=1610 RepID=UPI00201A3382|nr:hypothetical protein [Loigolactobacillus coryniformis]MCL5458077.1 hypothetical protein [Loigolactobacillus coryniformis]
MNLNKLEPDNFIEYLNSFINSDSKNLLVRGYFNQDKLTAVLHLINDNENIQKVVFATGNISEVPRLFNRSFKRGYELKNIRLNTAYTLLKSKIEFIKWERMNEWSVQTNIDLGVFYPVEGVLFSEKDTDKFLTHLSYSKARHNILLTTNDYSKRAEKLYPYVDESVILDTSQLDEQHESEMKTLTRNITEHDGEMPY